MVKEEEFNLDVLKAELDKAIEEVEADTSISSDTEADTEADVDVDADTEAGVKDKKVEEIKDKKKGEIAEDAEEAHQAVEEGFGNINQMIYERLDINRACLMILLVLILILIFKEDIMKTSFVKNLLK